MQFPPTKGVHILKDGATEKQVNKDMLKRIKDVDKMKLEDKKMVFSFLDAFITKTKLQALL